MTITRRNKIRNGCGKDGISFNARSRLDFIGPTAHPLRNRLSPRATARRKTCRSSAPAGTAGLDLICPPRPLQADSGGSGTPVAPHCVKSLRSARPIMQHYPTWLLVMRAAKKSAAPMPKTFPHCARHNGHYVSFTQCSAPYAPAPPPPAFRSPEWGIVCVLGLRPAKKMAVLRCLRPQPVYFNARPPPLKKGILPDFILAVKEKICRILPYLQQYQWVFFLTAKKSFDYK